MKKNKSGRKHQHLKRLYRSKSSVAKNGSNLTNSSQADQVNSAPILTPAEAKYLKKDIFKTLITLLILMAVIVVLWQNINQPAISGLIDKLSASLGF